MKQDKAKQVEVTIKRSGKLTLTEINALTQKILHDAQVVISAWNSSYEETFDFQRKVKMLKTKHGVLAAERAIVFIATKHKKVKMIVESAEYNAAIILLHNQFRKNNILTWKESPQLSQFQQVRNKLILGQVENANILELAKIISKSLVD